MAPPRRSRRLALKHVSIGDLPPNVLHHILLGPSNNLLRFVAACARVCAEWRRVVGGSAAYGTHPWHWYFTQGFPAVATCFAPLAFFGCVSGTLKGARAWEPFAVTLYCVLGYSLAAHKEFRFLMPALPPTLAAAGGALAAWQADPRTAWRTRRAVALVLLTQIPAAAYLSWWHQS